MTSMRCLVPVVLVLINLYETAGHGRLMDPVNRSSAHRMGFPTPVNWDDDGNYCGGFGILYHENNGKCGVCGDNYAEEQPRPNENGGFYGTGIIVRTYKTGSIMTARVDLTVNHMGYYKFALCPLKSDDDLETEKCFDAHPLELEEGGYEYLVDSPRNGDYFVKLRLPEGLTCEHCVLRWEYITGNNWGICEDGTGRLGCGEQETFRTCSDIKIE